MRNVLLAVATLAMATPLVAQTVVTPASPQGWILDDGKTTPGNPATITTAQPNNGLGSLQLNVDAGTQVPEARYGFTNPVLLSSLVTDGTFGFDFLADPSQVGAPTIRLFLSNIANTGNSHTTGSLGWFGTTGAGWQTASLDGNDGNVFLRITSTGQATDACANSGYSQGFGNLQTIDTWISDCQGTSTIDLRNAEVTGIAVDYGSFPGFTGNTTVYADNVNFSFDAGAVAGNFNFEPTIATPEPATVSLLALGFIGLAGVARKRKRAE